MKFNTKDEAYSILKSKHENNQSLTNEELIAVKEYFTEEELNDISFVNFKIEDCFNYDPAKLSD
jgi:hypothetical protein